MQYCVLDLRIMSENLQGSPVEGRDFPFYLFLRIGIVTAVKKKEGGWRGTRKKYPHTLHIMNGDANRFQFLTQRHFLSGLNVIASGVNKC